MNKFLPDKGNIHTNAQYHQGCQTKGANFSIALDQLFVFDDFHLIFVSPCLELKNLLYSAIYPYFFKLSSIALFMASSTLSFRGNLGDPNGTFDGDGIRASVADEHQAVHAEQGSGAFLGWTHRFSNRTQRRPDKHAAEFWSVNSRP